MATLTHARSSRTALQSKERKVEGLHAKWEVNAPLTDFQSDQVVDLAVLVTNVADPEKLSSVSSGKGLPTILNSSSIDYLQSDSASYSKGQAVAFGNNVHTAVAQSSVNESMEANKGGNLDPVVHTHHFFAWFADVESTMDHEQESMYRQHLLVMSAFLETCDKMIHNVDEGFECLDSLTDQYNFVSTKTESLRTACEELLTNRAELVRYADAIEERLKAFLMLERITLRLSAPNLSATSPVFVEVLQSIHTSLSYVKEHPDYVDSKTYLSRLQYQQNRALVLVKIHTVDLLKKSTVEVKSAMSDRKDAFTAAYGLYGSKASSVLTLMRAMQEGSSTYDEYAAVLLDCQTCYFAQRNQIILPLIKGKLDELNKVYQHDMPQWLRLAGSYIQRVCLSEYLLFHRFFPSACDSLHGFLETLTDIVYDEIRPHLIQTTDLNTLAELCDVVATEVLADLWSNADYSKLISFVTVMEQIQQDIQERLVYRTHTYVRREIAAFKPSAIDLAYPEKLEHKKEEASNGDTLNADANKSSDQLSPMSRDLPITDMYKTWYPPMYMTLMCLSMLYRCVDRVIFEGISHECISVCKESLVQASELITGQKSRLDGLLFLIKHLLTLREQIAPFDTDFVSHEQSLDFNSTRAAAMGFLTSTYESTSRLFTFGVNNPVYNLVREGAPTLREDKMDSKKEIDMRLRSACEELMSLAVERLSSPFTQWSARANAMMTVGTGVLSEQPWATPESLVKLGKRIVDTAKIEYTTIAHAMTIYLRNATTENVLLRPIKKRVLDAYAGFELIVSSNYSDLDALSLPSSATVNELLAEEHINGPSPSSTPTKSSFPLPESTDATSKGQDTVVTQVSTSASPGASLPISSDTTILANDDTIQKIDKE
eukprot:CFRG2915T1